jgi:hypothetical protein
VLTFERRDLYIGPKTISPPWYFSPSRDMPKCNPHATFLALFFTPLHLFYLFKFYSPLSFFLFHIFLLFLFPLFIFFPSNDFDWHSHLGGGVSSI